MQLQQILNLVPKSSIHRLLGERAPAPFASRTSLSTMAAVALSAGTFLAIPSDTRAGDGRYGGYAPSSSDIAQREIARRRQMREDARLGILEGDRLVAQEDYEAAIAEYQGSLELLPASPETAQLRNVTYAKWADASVSYAQVRADNGALEEAGQTVQAVLDYNPDHRGASTLMERLGDSGWYNISISPEHVADVQEVERRMQLAVGYFDSGQFDKSEAELNAVLRVDRYNSASQRMQERIKRELIDNYYGDARREARSRALAAVDAAWTPQVPPANLEAFISERNRGQEGNDDNIASTLEKLKIIIPKTSFQEITVEEALDFLRERSRQLDPEPDPISKGLNIILKTPSDATLTLDLGATPLSEVLNFIAELAQLKVKVEPYAVLLVPLTDTTQTMYNRTFRAPPDFISGGAAGGGAEVDDDPFADPGAGDTGGIQPRITAKEKLIELGVEFPDGALAFFDTATSRLVVRNTARNNEIIESIMDDLRGAGPKQIYITTKFIEISQTNGKELGFDWRMGAFDIGNDRVFGNGGVIGNSTAGTPGPGENRYPFTIPGTAGSPVGSNPISRGVRFGSNAISPDTIDGLIRDESLASALSPGIFGLAGVFTDPQFQVLVRGLDQKKGVDLMTAPSVVTRSGQRAKIEVIREFIYPVEFEPPEIPERFSGGGGVSVTDPNTGQIINEVSNFPVTPTTPTAFETRSVGVTLEVDPVLGEDGYTIDLSLAPEVVEFEGFINYGSPIQASAIIGGEPGSITITENRIEQPVFAARKMSTALTIWDGQTVGIGGLMREDVQSVEDKVPVLGDLPIIGRLWQNDAEEHFKRNLMIFVTARIIDPAGVPVHTFEQLQGGPAGAGSVEEDPLAELGL